MPNVDVLTAYDQKPIESLALQPEAEVFEMLERAYALHQDRDDWLPAHQRIAILERTAEIVASRVDDYAMQAAREGGKPLVDSQVEVRRAVEGIKAAAAEISSLTGREIPMGITQGSTGRVAYTYREPRGVVLAISAFNHPFNLIVHQAVVAIAAGCPVLVKPALTTPLSCRNLLHALYEAGLPEEWCRFVFCDNEVAGKLVSDPRVSFLTFIGSAKVGWSLRSQLAPGAACALEHGGVAPVIVDETADLDAAIPPLVKGGYYHAGQVCVSVQRLYVARSVAEELTAKFLAEVRKLKTGDPTDASTDVGPLILPRECDRVASWVDEAREKGGKILCGGRKISETCYEPTIVMDPPDDCRLSQAEIFGPVVAIYPYDDLADAIRRANAPDVFFQASVFTRNLDVALDCGRRLNGMAVMVNDHTAFRVDWMPFGGHRQSGLGLGGIRYSMEDMTLERMVVWRSRVLG